MNKYTFTFITEIEGKMGQQQLEAELPDGVAAMNFAVYIATHAALPETSEQLDFGEYTIDQATNVLNTMQEVYRFMMLVQGPETLLYVRKGGKVG